MKEKYSKRSHARPVLHVSIREPLDGCTPVPRQDRLKTTKWYRRVVMMPVKSGTTHLPVPQTIDVMATREQKLTV